MKKTVFILAMAATHAVAQELPLRESFVIENVHIISMESDQVDFDQAIKIADGVIQEIGPRRSISNIDEFEIIDGLGQFVMPGLFDMHVHFRHADERAPAMYLRAGVTFVREMNGRPFLLEWREKIAAGEMIGPRMIVAAPTIGNFSSPREGYPTPTTPDEARARVAEFKRAGYDLIKIHNFVQRDVFFAIIKAGAAESMSVAGHLPVETRLEEALSAGFRGIEHLTGYFDVIATDEGRGLDADDFSGTFFGSAIDQEKLAAAARATAASGAWNTPTVMWFLQNNPFSGSRDAWADPSRRMLGLENRLAVIKALHDAGANLMLGTDSDAGDQLSATAVYEELMLMTDAGLSPFQALRMATVAPAAFLGFEDAGKIRERARADLILLACNPLERIRCVQYVSSVIFDGRIIH